MSNVDIYGSSHYLDDLQAYEKDYDNLSKWIQCLDVRNNNSYYEHNCI
jgi:hypothetical protein